MGRLAPQRKGATDLYTIGVAGWADQDVFVKELDGTLASLTKVLPVDGRVLRLVNGPDTAKGTPLATRENIAAAARAVADVMDKDDDILILFMTSHGTRAGFGLQLPRRPLVEFAPRELAKILDGAGIRNRVVIVSACYSGTFVPPLANDNTIVITAADARNPSFGCAPGREWTFFGDAFFNRSLRPGADLRSAFNGARLTISEWELAEALPPSNPQAHFGPALVEKLAPLFASQVERGTLVDRASREIAGAVALDARHQVDLPGQVLVHRAGGVAGTFVGLEPDVDGVVGHVRLASRAETWRAAIPLPPFRYRTGRPVSARASSTARPARTPSSEVSTISPRNGIFGSARASRERMANQAPVMCSLR